MSIENTKAKLDGLSIDVEQIEREKLQAVFPQCFSEGKLDIDKLLALCGEYIDNDFEKYRFEWHGKAECLRLAQRRSAGTLRPCKEESVNFDTTANVYIEGDNLEVLKLLQIAYYRRVKMIYIDPPYNTGNDFIYEDDFADPIARYREVTAQTTKSNPETMGRFHTNWLNMMYPRLRLAANLLRDDGVIFISIDDGEQANMRKLCDEVFGEENFIANIIWQKVYSPRMDAQGFSASHDFVLCYTKQSFDGIRRETFSQNSSQFNFTDATTGQRYRRRSVRKEGSNSTRSERPNLWFPLTAPDGSEIYPVKPDGTEGRWRWSIETYNANLSKDMVEWVQTENGWQVYAKQYLDEEAARPPQTLWFHQEVGHNHSAAEELKKLFGANVFDSPKPKELIKKMLSIATSPEDEDIVLDFFSGSATTAHAVMQQNADDGGGNRQFIMVQLPEACHENSRAAKAGYSTICEVGKERIRRSGRKICEASPLTTTALDIGFKVFKLDTSNLLEWDETPVDANQADIIYDRMDTRIVGIKPDRSDIDLVYEVVLKLGYPLISPLEKLVIGSVAVYIVSGESRLMICLDKGVTSQTVEQMLSYSPSKIVLVEYALADDVEMANAYYILRDRGVELKLV